MTHHLTPSRAGVGPALVLGALLSGLAGAPALAQRNGAAPAPPAPATQPAPAAPATPAQPGAAPRGWETFTPMVLERVFRGPLRDTLVQRWRDPVDGAICFIYLPISAAAAGQGPYLIYGPNTIGSISCVAPMQVIQLQGVAPSPPPPPPAPPQRGR
ncbi:hypothetical protein [Falsiroseomonas selenitidurans]|uniref:Uncharacterized protein n=1 Tax=Falsiroseomonas selenitidurans TaxID=2716335 RepID=A0ABX1EC03_9PROT|nr:hypothetical protein [Falsiroseomonas selenitidurans]NKC33402.1 hypothetical protein [Falsiroseomonas selenitidurans]